MIDKSMVAIWLFCLAVLFAVADWYAVSKNISWLRYSAKPLVVVALGTWLILQPIAFSVVFGFFLALVFSLSGDILLLAPPRFLLAGLTSFIIAQICYVNGFNDGIPQITLQVFSLAGVIIIIGLFIFLIPFKGIKKHPRTRKLQGEAVIYYIVVTLMVFSATTTLFRPDWDRLAALCVAIGGLLFFASESLLAYDRFVHPMRYGRLYMHVL